MERGLTPHLNPLLSLTAISSFQPPDTQHWPAELRDKVEIHPTSQGATAVIRGAVDHETLKQAETFLVAAVAPRARQRVAQQFADHRALRQAMRAPAQLGISFAPIPQLCLNLEGYLSLWRRTPWPAWGDWNLLDFPVQLAGFSIHETVNSFEIDVAGERVKFRHVDALQLKLNEVASHVSEQDSTAGSTEVRKPYLSQLQLQAYLTKMLAHLMHDRVHCTGPRTLPTCPGCVRRDRAPSPDGDSARVSRAGCLR